jgi:hypothetical protein
MRKEEQDRVEKKLQIHRGFLREIYNISHSNFKLRKSLSRATLVQLKVLIAILRATSKGVIPIEKKRYEKISVNRFFNRVIAKELKNYPDYRKVLHLSRGELVDFTCKLLSVWQFILAPLFVLSENE